MKKLVAFHAFILTLAPALEAIVEDAPEVDYA